VTVTRKLVLAAVLLAAGFGVARLMGQPAARWYVPSLKSTSLASSSAPAVTNSSTDVAVPPLVQGGARLVPDYAADNPYQLRKPQATAEPVAPLVNESLSVGIGAPPPSRNESAAPGASFAPRVKLRDEAPRPVSVEPRAPSIVYAPPVLPQNVNPPLAHESRSASTDWRTSGLTPASYAQDAADDPAINTSYYAPAEITAGPSAVAPPPWPVRDALDRDEPTADRRTHIVVDGDSLERLAGRYLDDPTRAAEIYDANRELLADPNLLPIGVELVIPNRGSRTATEMPQSSVANDSPLRAASHPSGVRIRHLPPTASVTPRALLLPPVAPN
jgi:nucleoid-associated protein YgaU